jgi:peptidyl-tRNA hydrolase, PTH1 family
VKLIAGLGNPGRRYGRHRHNVGYLVVDELARRHGVEVARRSFEALTGSGVVGAESVILAKPETFMNLSGEAVAPLLRYYRLPPEALIVVHDDLDIERGRLRIAKGAGHGGHNGVASIIEALGVSDFIRVRVGIGRPPEGIDGANYVLSPFLEEELEMMEAAVQRAADAVEAIIAKGLAKAQQEFH